MKFENQQRANLETNDKPKTASADKYTGFIEPEIADVLKDSTFLSLIKSDGLGIDSLVSIINMAKVNL